MLNFYLTRLEHDAKKAEWSREVHEIKSISFQFTTWTSESDLIEYATPEGFKYLRHDGPKYFFKALPFSEHNFKNQVLAVMSGRKISNTEDGRKELSSLISPLVPLAKFHIEPSLDQDDGSINIDIRTRRNKGFLQRIKGTIKCLMMI